MRIAVMDQDEAARRELTEKLRTVFPEAQVEAFNSLLALFQYNDAAPLDILFTDVRLTPVDGYELIRILRQKQPFFAYVVSGSRENPDDLRWMNVNGCFTKPVALSELRQLRYTLLAEEAPLRILPTPSVWELDEDELAWAAGGLAFASQDTPADDPPPCPLNGEEGQPLPLS